MGSYCPQCGSKVREGAKFCGECGSHLPDEDNVSELKGEEGVEVSQMVSSEPSAPESVAPKAKEASRPWHQKLGKKLTEPVKIGSIAFMPFYAAIIVAVVTTVGVAFAAVMLYQNVIEPAIVQLQQSAGDQAEEAVEKDESDEQAADEQTTDAQESQEATEFSYEMQSATANVPADPYHSPGKRFEITYTYPVLAANGKSAAVEKINKAIKDSVDADVASSSSVADSTESEEWNKEGALRSACFGRSISVTYMDDSIVCFLDRRSDYSFGTHGGTTESGVVFDLKTGDVIDGASLFGLEGSDLSNATVSAVTAYANDPNNNVDMKFASQGLSEVGATCLETYISDDTAHFIDGCSRYYVAEEGLVYFVGRYVLGSYAAGSADIVVAAWEDESLVGTSVSYRQPTDDF